MDHRVRMRTLLAWASLSIALSGCAATDALPPTTSADGLTICQAASMAVGDRVAVTARFKAHGGILLSDPDPEDELSEEDYTPSSMFESDELCDGDQERTDRLIAVAAKSAGTDGFDSLERGTWVTVVGTIEELPDLATLVVLVEAEIAHPYQREP